MTPYKALSKYFGYKEFRPGQLEIINTILGGKNVLAVLPTGAGKSICYQIPALAGKNYSLVISPLIALMKDQVDSLNKIEKTASYINSTLDYASEQKVLNEIRNGDIKLLYVAPEKLESVKFIEQLMGLSPSHIFVDEAHCISEWGMDFRPSYRKIKEVAQLLGVDSISAFTATATPEVRKDIIEQLDLKEPEIFVSGFTRNNIAINVIRTNKKKEFVFKLLNEFGTPAIVYASTRRAAESVYKFLNSADFRVSYYHAGLGSDMRRLVQDEFIKGSTEVICATNAFGMGIDKSDIRTIIHYNVPGSIENYYQEIGRAGRDGKPSNVFLLYDEKDVNIQEHFIDSSIPSIDQTLQVYNLLYDYSATAIGNYSEKEIPIDNRLKDFFNLKNISSPLLNSCIKILRDSELLEMRTNFKLQPVVRSLLSPEELKKYIRFIAPAAQKNILLPLLKIYGGALFMSGVKINLNKISANAELSEERAIELFTQLDSSGIIEFQIPTSIHNIKLTKTRSKDKYVEINLDNIRKSHDRAKAKLNSMIDFVFSDDCRFDFILKYFGEKHKKYRCEKCDNCTDASHESNSNEFIAQAVLRTLHENRMNLRLTRLTKILQGKSKSTDEKKLSTFGVCRHYSNDEIDNTSSYLTAKGFLTNYDGILSLTEKGKENFTDELNLTEPETDFERQLQLFNRLRSVRKKIARKFSQTEQLICSDKILRTIAKKEPVSPAQFMAIDGTSQNLFFKAGADFIEEIKEFKLETEKKKRNNLLPDNLSELKTLIEKGYKFEEIASITKLPETIVSVQIESLIMLKPDTPINKLLDAKTIKEIESKIATGLEELKEIKAMLPSSFTYPKIRIVLAKVKSGLKNSF